MWQAFVSWFADVINLMYKLTIEIGVPSYGLAIIFMTIAIKLILFPITQKQLRSMRSMQQIQPRIKMLQEEYQHDKEQLNVKLMELYKDYNVNPLGGCLPLLIQMPIFIAFYQSLLKFEFAETSHAGFLWIPNIGNPDPYLILAILAALTTFIQQKITMVQSNDPTQRIMLYVMPMMMAFIAIKLPAGLPLYWVVFNILGIIQQLYVNKLQPNLTTTAGDVGTSEVVKGGKENNASPGSRKKGKKR